MMKAKVFRANLMRWFLIVLGVLSLSIVVPTAAQEESEVYTVGVQMMTEGLTSPVAMAFPNDGSGRLFVADQAGKIWIMSPDGAMMPDPFLDLTPLIVPLRTDYDERGVLGLAF